MSNNSVLVRDFSDDCDVRITFHIDGSEFMWDSPVFEIANRLGSTYLCGTIGDVIDHLAGMAQITDLEVPYVG